MAACWYLYRAFIMIHPLKTQKKKLSSTKKKTTFDQNKKGHNSQTPHLDPESCREKSKLALSFARPGPGPPLPFGGVAPVFSNREVGWTLDTFFGWVGLNLGHVMFCISVGPWKTSAVQPVSFRLLSKSLVGPKVLEMGQASGQPVGYPRVSYPTVKFHGFLGDFMDPQKKTNGLPVYLLFIEKNPASHVQNS